MQTGNDELIRRLAVVLRDSSDAIIVQDLQGNIIAWNRGAEKMFGYTEAEALRMNIEQIVPPGKKLEEMEHLKRVIEGDISCSFETRRVTKDGRLLDVWLVVTCLKDDSGTVDSIASTGRDITELRRKDTEIRTLRGLLPICASCKKIRDDKGYWHKIESYMKKHLDVDFSHGICPKCAESLYPEFNPYKDTPCSFR